MTDPNTSPSALTHIGPEGQARMVAIGDKPVTERVAVGEAFVRISDALHDAIRDDTVAKGDVLAVARLAGIQGAKRTDQLIPLCHQVPLTHADVRATLEAGAVRLVSEVRATWRTGVEMEALTAVSIAALTVIDMGKAVDRAARIESVRLLEKRGGRRGDYVADPLETS